MSIANKGKVKVAGTLANGTKVSASGQLSVGEEWCCVPVLVTKKARLAFVVWLPKAATSAALPVVVWLPKAATSAALPVVVGLGDGVKVGKPGTLKGGAAFRIDEAAFTAMWGRNALLKLTYKAKDGTFKGSFKAYSDVNGKPKATKVDVTGVLVDGVGYGAATVKKVGGVPVTISPR